MLSTDCQKKKKGHTIYTDRGFSGPTIFYYLCAHVSKAVGTVKTN